MVETIRYVPGFVSATIHLSLDRTQVVNYAVVTRVTGTFKGEMALPDGRVIPPTGKAFDVEFGRTSKWKGDQLIWISAFWDSALQARQMGVG